MPISEEEEAAFGGRSSNRPEYLLESTGPGRTLRLEENNGNSSDDEAHESNDEAQTQPPAKKKKRSIAEELFQARVDRDEQFNKFLALKEKELEAKVQMNTLKLQSYNQRTHALERFLDVD